MGKERLFRIGMLHFSSPFGDELLKRLNNTKPFLDKNKNRVRLEAKHIDIVEYYIFNNTPPYHLIIDRGSHALEQALGILNIFAYRGIHIINNLCSFHYFNHRKDFAYALVWDLGIPVPKTVILPQHTTVDLEPQDFKYHKFVKWEKIAETIGFPCYLKPSAGRRAKDISIIHNMDELIARYNESGSKLMLLQTKVPSDHDWHVRCLCIGRRIIPYKFIFGFGDTSRYIFENRFLSDEAGRKVLDYAKVINRAFGYEMNSIEFIIDKEGEAWAIDFNNPVPDSRREILGEILYNDYLSAMVNLVRDVVDRPLSDFLPDINPYARISRMNISSKDKFQKALVLAEKYYR